MVQSVFGSRGTPSPCIFASGLRFSCLCPRLLLAVNTPAARPPIASMEHREYQLAKNAGARLPIRRCVARLATVVRGRSTAGGPGHARSSFRAGRQRPEGQDQLHHRNRWARSQPADSSKRGAHRRPPCAADGAYLEIPSRNLQRRSDRNRRQDRVFQPIARVRAAAARMTPAVERFDSWTTTKTKTLKIKT